MDHRPDKITLEELLRLKRAERPREDFWVKFEHQLREKQLTALLERRPWWQAMPAVLGRRAYLPIGATAVLALTLVVVRYSATAPVAEIRENPAGARVARLNSASRAPRAEAPVAAPQVAAAPLRAVLPLSERMPDRTADLTPWSAPRSEETPSSKTIAASLARLEQVEPDLAHAVRSGSLAGASARAQADSAQPVVELAGYSSMASKRSRLLAQLDDRRFTPEPQAPELVRERLARRLADSDFNDGFGRVGLERGGVSLRF